MSNAGYRQIHPEMWDDPFVLDLESDEKLLFIYLFSNARTSLCGLYEISTKQIIFHTGLEKEYINKAVEKFQKAGKIIKEGNIYFVVNQFKRHFSRSPKVVTRINIDIESICDCKPKTVCIQKYEYLYGYRYPIDTVDKENNIPIDTETHKIKEDNKRSNEDINEDEVVDNDSLNNNAPNLIKTFTDYTKLKAGKGAKELSESLIAAGVTNEDIISAVDFLNGSDKYKCVRFLSIGESVIAEMNMRKARQKTPDQEDYQRYIKGEYGEVGSC